MAEFIYNEVQNVALNAPFILNDSIRCPKGYILHQNGSAIVTLRGIVNNPSACSARYRVMAKSNIAITTGGAVTAIALAIALQGEAQPESRSIVTPAAVEEYGTAVAICTVDVPRGCCPTLSLRYVQATDDPATTPTPVIEAKNTILIIDRVA